MRSSLDWWDNECDPTRIAIVPQCAGKKKRFPRVLCGFGEHRDFAPKSEQADGGGVIALKAAKTLPERTAR
jgi:hypothetical protein